MEQEEECAFIGNYRKLGYLMKNIVLVQGDGKTKNFYKWNPYDNSLKDILVNNKYPETTISYYQVADYLYHHEGLRTKKLDN